MLHLYHFTGMGEQAFRKDSFIIPPLVPVAPGSQRVRVDGIGNEAFSWNENELTESTVAFREGSNVVVVSVEIFPSSMDNSSRAATAISLAKDAASAVAG
jgi:hypothetical protein